MSERTPSAGDACTIYQSRLRIPPFPFCRIVLKADRPKDPRYPKELNSWGDRIRTRRLDLGLRQSDVAKRIGVALVTLVSWENNKAKPRPEKLIRIRKFLGAP